MESKRLETLRDSAVDLDLEARFVDLEPPGWRPPLFDSVSTGRRSCRSDFDVIRVSFESNDLLLNRIQKTAGGRLSRRKI